MLTLIHGDNQVQSRQLLTQLVREVRESGINEVQYLAGKSLDLTQLSQSLLSNALFDAGRLVVIEELFAKTAKKVLNDSLGILSKLDPGGEIGVIIWEPKSITKNQAKKLSNFSIKEHKTSAAIFQYLDLFGTASLQQALSKLRLCCRKDSPQLVLYMLARQVRLMIQVMHDEARLAPWQKGKLKKQIDSIGKEKVMQLHAEVLEVDYQSKTGQLAIDLADKLELITAEYSHN